MSNLKSIFVLIVLFIGIALIGLATFTMMSEQEIPDQNNTPELYQDYLKQQTVQKPFLSAFQVLLIFILLAIIGAGVVIFLKAMRGGRGDSGGGF
jgi:NADH:ubiquinone oxidoreductase subunit 6 (subunit J)